LAHDHGGPCSTHMQPTPNLINYNWESSNEYDNILNGPSPKMTFSVHRRLNNISIVQLQVQNK
jgi:hypothetical protein